MQAQRALTCPARAHEQRAVAIRAHTRRVQRHERLRARRERQERELDELVASMVALPQHRFRNADERARLGVHDGEGPRIDGCAE